MSFLSLRRGRQQPLKDSGNIAGSAPGSIYSLDKPPSVLRRLTSKLSRTGRRAANVTDPRAPIGNIAFPRGSSYWHSRSPSPDPSLDIRMPAGLGRRVSEMEEREEVDEDALDYIRKRSVSSPPIIPQAGLWRRASPVKETEVLPALARVPEELLTLVLSFSTRSDLLALLRVSKAFSRAALRALYEDLDLRSVDDEHLQQCVASLVSRRHVATLVRRFACGSLPGGADPAASLDVVAFAIALTNMDKLHTLTLPHFDARLLTHAPFALQRLTLLSKNIGPEELQALIGWLARQPTITSLSFPALTLPALPELPCIPDTPDTPDTPLDERDALPPSPIPHTVLPRLQRFHGPVALAAALVPGRPIASIKLPIQCTLYEGLRPSAIMGALAYALGTLRTLTIRPATAKIDTRSIERVIMSAGSEVGSMIETLEVHWVLDDEALYKLVAAALGRFRALRTLRLRRDSPPPHPPSPLLEFPLPPSSAPTTPVRSSTSSLLTAPPGSARRLSSLSAGPGAGADTPFPRVHERAHLGLWSKACPTLRKVFFLSGAEWVVHPRRLEEGGGPMLPPYEFMGYNGAET